MEIQKYKAKIVGTDTNVIGYITEVREDLGKGTIGPGTEYLISVTEKSMQKGPFGTFKIDKSSIKPVVEKSHKKELIDFLNWIAAGGEDIFYEKPEKVVSEFLNTDQ